MRTRPLALFGLVLCQAARAARPFCTDDAGTVAPGSFEAELGTESWKDAADFGLQLKHGITPRMDLGIFLGHTAYPSEERAFAPAELTAKFALVPDLLSASFTSILGTTGYRLNGVATKSVGDLGLSVNVGGEFEGGSSSPDLTWGASPSWSLGPATIGAEISGDQYAAQAWKAGGQFHATPAFALDAAIGSTLESDPQWKITAGAWFAFGASEGGK